MIQKIFWDNLLRKKNELEELLDQCNLFTEFSRKEKKIFGEMLHQISLLEKEPLFKEKDNATGIYFVSQGKINIYQEKGEDQILISTLDKYDFTGESHLFNEKNQRNATAIAETKTIVYGFFASDLEQLMTKKPTLALKFIYQICRVSSRRIETFYNLITESTVKTSS